MTLYLKTETEATMKSTLAEALGGFVGSDENGAEVLAFFTHQWSVDWDIPITQTPAVFDEAGETVVEPAVMESGFFCNIIVSDKDIDTTSIEAIDQQPNTPQRRFA